MAMTEEDKRRFIEEEKLRRSLQGKSTGVAIVLSALVPGLGDLYCGSWIKFLIFFVLVLVCVLLTFVGIGIFLLPVVWIVGIISAVMSASKTRTKGLRRAEREVAAS
jgi:TM2 domain-containing membrane protein YozV